MNAHAGFSLRTRLLAALLALISLVWGAATVASYRQARHELGELLDAHLAQSAALLVAQASEEIGEIELEHLPEVGDAHQRVAMQVWDNGALRVHSRAAPNRPLAPFARGFSDTRVRGGDWRVYSTRSPEGAWVQVGEPVSARNDIADAALIRQAWPMLLALPLLGFGAWLAIGRGLRPLERLARTVEARAALDTTPIPDEGAPAEILPLLQRLNGLFARTGESIARERRFIGDASHELRTPVAAIRAQAQVARAARDDAERNRALDSVVAGCDRMARLTEQLLTLSRLDAGMHAGATATASLRGLAADVLDELAPLLRTRRASVRIDIDPVLQAPHDAMLWRIVLRNLVENALHYGGDGVSIAVQATREAGALQLDVRDDGPGIAPGQRALALQRFQRLDTQAAAGAGLGLAIVQRIADAWQARLELGDGLHGRGLGVALRVPVAATEAAETSTPA